MVLKLYIFYQRAFNTKFNYETKSILQNKSNYEIIKKNMDIK